MQNIQTDRKVVSILFALLIPGAGHIHLNQINKGIKIAILFVIFSYMSLYIFPNIIPFFFNAFSFPVGDFEPVLFILSQSIGYFPVLIIWYKQLKDIMKIHNNEI